MTARLPDTKLLGLEIGLDLIRLVTGREHLHYGYWESGQEVTLATLLAAQEAYTDKLLAMLPTRPHLSILDIGGGAGETARRLLAMGHRVDVVVPSDTLLARCRANLGERATLYHSTFEDFRASTTYDVCLFSESFQYISLEIGLKKAITHLKPDGSILIADSFRKHTDHQAPRPVGGGWPLDRFLAEVDHNDLAITVRHDITRAVAPSIDLERRVYHFAHDTILRTKAAIESTNPRVLWLLIKAFDMFLGPSRLAKLADRFTGTNRTAEDFIKHNTYLMLTLTR